MSDDLIAWVHRHGDVAHSSALRAAGFSARQITAAVAAGRLERVRRSWLVGAQCPPARRAAATMSGRLTCVSAAHGLGLWVPEYREPHVWIPSTASRIDATDVRVHRARPPLAVPRTEPIEPVVNVLFHVARCLPRTDAIAVWESAIRRNLVDAAVLGAVQWHSRRAAEYARIARHLSDSGLETHFCELMAGIGVTVRQQEVIDGHPVDGRIGELLVVQLDGFAFHRTPADRRRDLRQDARLVLRGYTVLRFDYAQVLFDPEYVIDTVRTALAQGRHRAPRG